MALMKNTFLFALCRRSSAACRVPWGMIGFLIICDLWSHTHTLFPSFFHTHTHTHTMRSHPPPSYHYRCSLKIQGSNSFHILFPLFCGAFLLWSLKRSTDDITLMHPWKVNARTRTKSNVISLINSNKMGHVCDFWLKQFVWDVALCFGLVL